MNAWLSNEGHVLTQQQFNIVMDSFRSCPLPLFLKLSFDEAIRWKSYSVLTNTSLEKNIKDAINSLFARLERLHGKILVSHAFGLITASKNGISDAELDEILSIDDEVLNDVYQYWTPPVRKIPPLLWIRIRSDLGDYIVYRGASGVLVNNWYHRQFAEAAIERYLSPENKMKYHQLLAEYFLGTWSEGKKKPFTDKTGKPGEENRLLSSQPNVYAKGITDGEEVFNYRKLSELPTHLLYSKNIDGLKKQVLYNYDFLLRKLQAFGYQYVYEDTLEAFQLNRNDRDIKLIHQFFKMSARTLSVAPNQLPAQLIGRMIDLKSKSPLLTSLLNDAKLSSTPCFYPSQRCFDAPGGPLIQVLVGHKQMVNHMCLTSDKKKLLSVGYDSLLK